jgi:flotillin
MPSFSTVVALIAVLAAIVFVSFVLLLVTRYKRCPSNSVLVIYGKVGGGRPARTIHGGAAFVLPLVQDYAFLRLEPIQIEIPLKDALSVENIRVNVPSVFTVAIGTESEYMQNAAIRLLGLDTAQIKKQAEDIIFGQLRQVIASMSIEEINRDREKFLHNIQSSLEPELRKIGMVLINVNITDITDESGYIEAIGKKAASQAIQQARGDVADQEKMGEVRVAEAEREKLVKVADANKLREIGVREAQRDQAVRVAELEKEQRIGEETAAFQREAQVKDAEKQMRVQVANANAQAVKGEKEADRDRRVAVAEADAHAVDGENLARAKIAGSNADLLVKQSLAYQTGETSKREAEAAVLEAQNRAMTKAAVAEAERIEAERRAQLEAPAKAQKAQIIVEAEAEAEKRRLEAQGEAAAIFAKLEAEARGEYEILAKKGEGLRRIVEACGGSQQAFQMLMLEHLDNLAQTAAQAISNIKFDKVIVWEGGRENGGGSAANFLQSLARSMPPMLQIMKDIGGVELPDYLARLVDEDKKENSGKDGPTQPGAAPNPPENRPAPNPSGDPPVKPGK